MTNHQTQNCEWKSQDIFYKLESEPTFMRTSQRICEVSSKYQSEILAVDRFNNEYANAKSILDIMPFLASNFIKSGAKEYSFSFVAFGHDSAAALKDLSGLIERKFDMG